MISVPYHLESYLEYPLGKDNISTQKYICYLIWHVGKSEWMKYFQILLKYTLMYI